MTDNDIKKALECCSQFAKDCRNCPFNKAGGCASTNKAEIYLAYINRLEAENKKFKERQKPTAASGYKIENGKVVFFTNMLGGCKIVKENLEEVVKTLNELLQECYSKDEIAFALKCKTEELETAKAEIERLQTEKDNLIKTYSECQVANLKEFAEIVKANRRKLFNYIYSDTGFDNQIDNLLKEMIGE